MREPEGQNDSFSRSGGPLSFGSGGGGLSQKEEETAAVIGGADGPTSIFVRSNDGSALDAAFEEDADQ